MPSQNIQNQINELWAQAKKHKVEGKWQESVNLYSRILQLNPNFARAYVERGLIFQEMGSPDKALADFEFAIQIDPLLGYAYYGRSWAKSSHGDHEGALEDAKKGMLLDSKDTGIYFRRIGIAYQGLKKFNEAIEAFNEAIRLNSDRDEGTIYNRGMCYAQMKEYTLALADFNRSLELNPDWASAFSARGNVYLQLKEYNKAIEDSTHAIKYQPNYLQAHLVRGHSHKALGNDKKARADFKNALKLARSQQQKQQIERELKSLKKNWWDIF